MAVAIGSKVRPEFTSDYGRVACFARRGAQLFFVTCDHVVKAYSGHPDQGPIPMHAPDESGEPTCGVYGGDSLIEPPDRFEGDLAMVRIRDTPGDPGVLPPGGPASQVARIALPVPGESVLVWSGRWGSFLPARVVAVPSSQSLPHPR